MGSARKFPVHVEPSSLLAHETADLVQPMSAAAGLVACDEFHRGAVCRFRQVFLQLQSQPLGVVCREIKRVSSRHMGESAGEELVFEIGLRDRSRGDDLLEALRRVDGVAHVSLMIRTEYAEV